MIAAKPFVTVGSPPNAATDPQGLRFYTWQGVEYPSVTTLRRMAGIPWTLHEWELSRVIDRVMDTMPAIRVALESGEPGAAQSVRRDIRAAATERRDLAAALGTAVHVAAAEGTPLTEVAPDVAPRLRQYLSWRAESGVEILAAEFQVWNLTVGYAGQVDLLGRFPDGSVWVVDIKTGKGLYLDHVTQVAHYLMAEFVGQDDVRDERVTALLKQATGIGVLHLEDGGWEFRSLRFDRETWAAAAGLTAYARWSHGNSIEAMTLGVRRGGR